MCPFRAWQKRSRGTDGPGRLKIAYFPDSVERHRLALALDEAPSATRSRLREAPAAILAVVIPAYNAESSIAAVLDAIPEWVRHVVVVSDGSTDNTSATVRRVASERVHLIEHTRNQGVGAAMLTGYDAALALGAEVIVKIDADGQMDPAAISVLARPVLQGEADYSKGNRFIHARELAAMPLHRRIGNAALSFLAKVASGYWPVFDVTNGYTAIHSSVLAALDRNAIARDFFFETSLLIELGRARAVVQDVYLPARYLGEKSSLSARRAAARFPLRLVRATARRLVLQYFIRDFTAVSLYLLVGSLLVLFGTVWGTWHWIVSVQAAVAATTGTVMLAVLPLILGMQLLLQAVALDIDNVPRRPIHPALMPRRDRVEP